MDITAVKISNMALLCIGIRERIASLEPPRGQEAVACAEFYETTLERTLCQYPWTFATKRKTLTLIEENPNDEWLYRYEYPSDCVSPQRIQAGARNVPTDLMIKWQVEGTNAAIPDLYYEHHPWRKSILTDEAAPVLVYTSDSVPPGLYPGHFVNLLVWNLATQIAPGLKDMNTARMAMEAARIALLDARTNALNEGVKDNPLESEFVRARD